MIFWKKNRNEIAWQFISFLIETGIVLSLAGKYFTAFWVCLTPFKFFSVYFSFKSLWFNTQIFHSVFFYTKTGLLILALFRFFPEIFKNTPIERVLLACLLSFLVSIVIKLLTNIGFCNQNPSLLICSNHNLKNYFSLFPSIAKKIICVEEKNFIELVKIQIEKYSIKNISVDSLENSVKIIMGLNGSFPELNLTCLEIGNKNLFTAFFERFCSHSEEQKETHNFFGARVLIIGNNEELILYFIQKSYKLECSSLVLVTDCIKINEKFSGICKTVLFIKDVKFRDIENKYAFDIIFDTYIIRSYNFQNYRAMARELLEVIKNKKAIVSVVKNAMSVDEWLMNRAKEALLKKFHDTCYGLTVISFRCGEFTSKNFFINKEIHLVFRDFLIQSPQDIADAAWKGLWNVEKGSINILGNVISDIKRVKSETIIKIHEIEMGQKISYEVFDHHSQDSIEILNKDFVRYKVNFSMAIKTLADNVLDSKTVVTSEEIAKAFLS